MKVVSSSKAVDVRRTIATFPVIVRSVSPASKLVGGANIVAILSKRPEARSSYPKTVGDFHIMIIASDNLSTYPIGLLDFKIAQDMFLESRKLKEGWEVVPANETFTLSN